MTLTPEINDKGLTDRETLFLEVLFTEAKGNIRKAMTLAGYAAKEPQSSLVKKLQKEIRDRAKEYLGAHSAQAVISLIEVLQDPSIPGSKTTISAVKEVLDRAHVGTEAAPPTVNEKNIFILPEKAKVTISVDE